MAGSGTRRPAVRAPGSPYAKTRTVEEDRSLPTTMPVSVDEEALPRPRLSELMEQCGEEDVAAAPVPAQAKLLSLASSAKSRFRGLVDFVTLPRASPSGPAEIHAAETSVKERAPQTPTTDGESAAGISSHCRCGLSWMAWASLIVFMVQFALAGLLVRYTKSFVENEYSSEAAVLFQEVIFKLPISLMIYSCECGGPVRMVRALLADMCTFPIEWLKMTFPAAVYTLQMNMLYIGFENLPAAAGSVTYQSKIIFTALCTVVIMQRRLSVNRWLAIFILFVGVICVQDFSATKPSGKSGQSQVLGTCAFLLAALCSAFASVYFEKMLKTGRKPSLWLRNIQLSLFGAIAAASGVALKVLTQPESQLATKGLLHGIDALVWFSFFWQGGGGLIIALTIKYADNIIRCFAQTGSILIIAIVSHFILDEAVTVQFCMGGLLVTVAIFIYSVKAEHPRDICYPRTKLLPAPAPVLYYKDPRAVEAAIFGYHL